MFALAALASRSSGQQCRRSATAPSARRAQHPGGRDEACRVRPLLCTYQEEEGDMSQQVIRYPCLTPAARIISHSGESILANVDNGKWIRVDDNVLPCLSSQQYEAAVDSLLTLVSAEEANEFVTLLLDIGLVNYDRNNPYPLEMQFEVINAYLNVTDFCNLQCQHCYFGSNPNLTHGLPHKTMCEVVTKLHSSGIKHLVVAGGEPLTRPNIGELFEHIHNTGFETVTLLTNGTIHPTPLVSAIAKCITGVHVSVDGPDEASNAVLRGSGNFNRAIHGIEVWQAAGAEHIQVVTTITSQNISRMREMRDMCDHLEVEFGTTIFAEAGRGCQHTDLAPSQTDLIDLFLCEVARVEYGHSAQASVTLAIDAGISCGAGTFMVSLDCYGNVYPCHFFHQPKLLIGNILEEPDLNRLMENSPVATKFRQSTVEYRKCHGCSVEYFCKGGCLAHAVLAHPDSEDPWTERDTLCEVHRIVLGAQLWPSA